MLIWITNTGRKMLRSLIFVFCLHPFDRWTFDCRQLLQIMKDKSPVFKADRAANWFALTILWKSPYSMDVILLLRLNYRVHLLNWNVYWQKVGFQISCRLMTSQQIKNLFACRVLTSLLNAATSVVQMYKGIHPTTTNIHHPCVLLWTFE